jgi:hypothetical protein
MNPLLEAGSSRTIVLDEFADMTTLHTTETAAMKAQVRIGGDAAKRPPVPSRESGHRNGRPSFPSILKTCPDGSTW